MITLSNLERRRGAKHKIKRIGRGYGSGRGGHASTRGVKGQRSRKGSSFNAYFEGGQMPLVRRLPKRGFNNIFRKEMVVVNLEKLVDVPKSTTVNLDYLKKQNLVPLSALHVKILGEGNLKHALTLQVHAVSKAAQAKVEKAGGKVEVLSGGH